MESLKNSLAVIGAISIITLSGIIGFKTEMAYKEFKADKEKLKRSVGCNKDEIRN